MSSTTKKSSDELKREVDSALNQVGQDLTELRAEFTPKQVVNEFVPRDKIALAQKGYYKVQESVAKIHEGVERVEENVAKVRSSVESVQTKARGFLDAALERPLLLVGGAFAIGVLLAVTSSRR